MSSFMRFPICASYCTLSITDEQFYAWSEKAREEKKKCDREVITLEEFQQWLRDSKI